jgi:menaquinone-dependent protoporphyrinogen IX oxidase
MTILLRDEKSAIPIAIGGGKLAEKPLASHATGVKATAKRDNDKAAQSFLSKELNENPRKDRNEMACLAVKTANQNRVLHHNT